MTKVIIPPFFFTTEHQLQFEQSCFSDTHHIYATTGDSYVSDNVWVIRFGLWVNKVASQEKINFDSLYNDITLDSSSTLYGISWGGS